MYVQYSMLKKEKRDTSKIKPGNQKKKRHKNTRKTRKAKGRT